MKISFYEMFWFATILIAFGNGWDTYASILVAISSVLWLIKLMPLLIREIRRRKSGS